MDQPARFRLARLVCGSKGDRVPEEISAAFTASQAVGKARIADARSRLTRHFARLAERSQAGQAGRFVVHAESGHSLFGERAIFVSREAPWQQIDVCSAIQP